MANQQQMPPESRSPRALATRGELYFGLFLIWIFLAFVLGELLQSEHSWSRLIYWVVSLLMVAMYAIFVVGMWWIGRRERP